MKRTFNFGQIDYNGNGRRTHRVSVDIELTEREKGPVFSASGSIRYGYTHSGEFGQCLDTIAKYVHTPLFQEIHRLWTLYHLNDMHAECEHQAEQGWCEIAKTPVAMYKFSLTHDACRAKTALEKKILTAAKEGKCWQTSKEEQMLLSLRYGITHYEDALPADLASFYELKGKEEKLLGYLTEEEHPQGILCKKCPVCGYEYGKKWNYFPIPDADLARIKELIEKGV